MQVLVSLPTDLATTLLRTALVPDLHLPPVHPGHEGPLNECASIKAARQAEPPVLWFPHNIANLSPALLPLVVQALAPSVASRGALSLDLLLFPAAHDVVSSVLPGFQHLRTLHIAFSHNADVISDTFFERTVYDVCSMASLESLSLKRLGRRGACVCALAESLPNARQLSSLALADIPLKRTAGAELVGALRALPVLARLELNDCPTDDATVTRLRRALRTMPSVRELALHKMKLPGKLAAMLIADCARLPALNVLTLDESLAAFFAGARGGAPTAGSSGSDGPFEGNSGNSGDSADGSGIAEDAALAERLAVAIGSAATLQELRITQTAPAESTPPAPPGTAALPPRSEDAPAVTHMPLLFSDALSRHISRCVSLTRLHLSHVVRGSCLGDVLSAVPQLRSLTVQGVPLDDIAAEGAALGLRQVRKLHHIDLCHCKLSVAGVQLLSAALRSCSRLRVLRLCRSGHGPQAAAALAECLPKLPLLQELDIEGWGIAAQGMQALAPALGRSRALRVLNFAWNRITADGMQALGRHLTAPELLQSLNLKFNCIGNTGMRDLAAVLRRARSLTDLELGGNMFGADGMRSLCAVLVGGARVGEALPGCAASFTPPPAQSMAMTSRPKAAVPLGAGPPQLRVLGLSGCSVGMEGVEALAAAVPQLHSLRVLDFPDLLLMYKMHRTELFRVMAAMRSTNPLLKVQT